MVFLKLFVFFYLLLVATIKSSKLVPLCNICSEEPLISHCMKSSFFIVLKHMWHLESGHQWKTKNFCCKKKSLKSFIISTANYQVYLWNVVITFVLYAVCSSLYKKKKRFLLINMANCADHGWPLLGSLSIQKFLIMWILILVTHAVWALWCEMSSMQQDNNLVHFPWL